MENRALVILFFLLVLSCFIAQSYGKKQIGALSHIYKEMLKINTSIDRSHFNASHRLFHGVKVDSEGMKKTDRIDRLPKQPHVKFKQYGGYVTVNKTAGRAFFYYFVEAQHSHHNSLPLLLWLNRRYYLLYFLNFSCIFRLMVFFFFSWPGCSSLAYGAMQEIGPFRIGNAVINDETDVKGMFEYFASHALISDETSDQIMKYCDFSPKTTNQSDECNDASDKAQNNIDNIDISNIYAPICSNSSLTDKPKKTSAMNIDPCSDDYVIAYLNRPDVQEALHANVTEIPYEWQPCSDILEKWEDSPSTVIPLLKEFIANGLRVWIFRYKSFSFFLITTTYKL
ncbi:hypothetical protein BUALT_Bualt01G0161000 [Buddleja alternifolia]|uniref:Uncharacterized protein n=1 Tax=Buddleja alternifolia TaxID=168488 RepID=A0AAV6Y7Q4_9LAMI|nr:hypothetical protein BUALT_Bualt01G0161000 [Buddleja alternifolia]